MEGCLTGGQQRSSQSSSLVKKGRTKSEETFGSICELCQLHLEVFQIGKSLKAAVIWQQKQN